MIISHLSYPCIRNYVLFLRVIQNVIKIFYFRLESTNAFSYEISLPRAMQGYPSLNLEVFLQISSFKDKLLFIINTHFLLKHICTSPPSGLSVKCLAHEQNTMSPARKARSGFFYNICIVSDFCRERRIERTHLSWFPSFFFKVMVYAYNRLNFMVCTLIK